MEEKEIIGLIKKGSNNIALNKLYSNYPAFKNSFIKSGGNSEAAADIFQQALLVLIEKITDSNFELTCKINSYLFSVCRNLSLIYFNNKGKNVKLELDDNIDYCEVVEVKQFVLREQRFEVLDKVLSTIGEKCKRILILFYVKKMSLDSISKDLGYKNETTAKTQKFKCLEGAKKKCADFQETIKTSLS